MCLLGSKRWNDALNLYAISRRAGGLSPGTIRLHRHYLRQLAGRHSSPWSVTTAQLLDALSVEHWKPETRKSARAAVRSFYRWAHNAGHIEHDPAAGLPPVKVPPGVPRPAPEQVLLDALRTAQPRVRLMIALAAYAGLRAAEIARVHSDDVVDGQLYVVGKGGRGRVVPLTAQLGESLSRFDGYVFPNRLGSHVSAGHVSKLVSQALPAGWTAHTLRHRLATRAYAGTRDLLAVGALLGHSRPETTQRYVAMPADALRAAIAAAAPAA